MQPDEFAEAKTEALGMAQELVDHAAKFGWQPTRDPKANKKFAFVTLRRVAPEFEVQEDLKAFYAIDADADDDQVTHVAVDGTQTVLDPEDGSVRAVVEAAMVFPVAEQDETDEAVPPTSAAHSAAHQDVPPTSIHRGIERVDVPPTALSAAHADDGAVVVPPTNEEKHRIVPPADEAAVAREATQHEQAAEATRKNSRDHPAISQQETHAAVRHQQTTPNRNWSTVASPLTEPELLKAVSNSEVVWLNSLSGALDRATVNGSTKTHPPHVTPTGYDPEDHDGEDLRILHFLETGGGFRSVAVARIRKIG